MNRDNVISMLKEGVHTVTFVKKDGTKRVMNATLKPDVIEEVSDYGYSDMYYDKNQIRCIDTDKKEWRSFLLDSVISFD